MESFAFIAPVLVHRFAGSMQQHHLPLPDDVDAAFRAAGVRRVEATLKGVDREGDGHTVRRGIQSLKSVGRFLVLSRDLMRTLGVQAGDLVVVEVRADPEPDRIDLGELADALADDADAKARFDGMTPGKQRGLAHYVTSAKRPETRRRRAEEIATKLRTHTLHQDLHPS